MRNAIQLSNPTTVVAYQRIEMVDVVRFLAAVGVIVLHIAPIIKATAPFGYIGCFAVPFFTIVAVALTVDGLRSDLDKSLSTYAGSRLLRIYVPFLIWTLAYLILRDVKYHFFTQHPVVVIKWQLLIVGSAHHLWFLPFILLITIFVAVVARFLLFRLPAWLVVSISLGAGISLLLAGNPVGGVVGDADEGLNLAYFWAMSWNMLPAALGGIGLGRVWREIRDSFTGSGRLWALAGLVAAVLSLAPGPGYGYSLALQHLSGIGCVLFALGSWNNRLVHVLASWGKVSYGIYLVHVFWYLALDLTFRKLHVSVGSIIIWLNIALTIVLSTLSALLLAKSRFTAWTIGMAAPKN